MKSKGRDKVEIIIRFQKKKRILPRLPSAAGTVIMTGFLSPTRLAQQMIDSSPANILNLLYFTQPLTIHYSTNSLCSARTVCPERLYFAFAKVFLSDLTLIIAQ